MEDSHQGWLPDIHALQLMDCWFFIKIKTLEKHQRNSFPKMPVIHFQEQPVFLNFSEVFHFQWDNIHI